MEDILALVFIFGGGTLVAMMGERVGFTERVLAAKRENRELAEGV